MLFRKRRTRSHVIADLSVNHVERHVLLCGCTVERFWHDYGYDLLLTTYNANGEVENGDVRLQVKATDFLRYRRDGQSFSFRVEAVDLRLWLREVAPVILIVYDALREDACWLYVQAYFESLASFDLSRIEGSVTLFRDAISDQLEEINHA